LGRGLSFHECRDRLREPEDWPRTHGEKNGEQKKIGQEMPLHFRSQKFPAQIAKRPALATNYFDVVGLHIFWLPLITTHKSISHVTNREDCVTERSRRLLVTKTSLSCAAATP